MAMSIKGNQEKLRDYPRISLLADIYRLFSKGLTKRLTSGENQLREQARFLQGYTQP